MTGNKQQQTHTKILKAGVPLNIDQPCEFIFIDQGTDLDFVIGDSRLSGRKAGDFARFDRPVQSVRVVSPYDQVIKLVLGFGEFSRLIVSGELNVSAYISTQSGGVADALPADITREVGAVSLATEVMVGGNEVVASGMDSCYGATYKDGKFYAVISTGAIVELGLDTVSGVDFTYPASAGFSSSNMNSLAITDGFRVFMRHIAGAIYKADYPGADLVPIAPAGTLGGYITTTRRGLHIWGDRIYCLHGDGTKILSFDFFGQDVREEIAISHATDSIMLLGAEDRLYSNFNSVKNFAGYRITANGIVRDESLDFSYGSGVSGASYYEAITPDTLHGIRWTGIQETRDITTYGELYSQPVGDASRRVTQKLFDRVASFDRYGATVVSFDWLPFVVSSVGGGTDYLDYLTGYKYDNGRAEIAVNSGTQTFARRGMSVPDLTVVDGSVFEISILPAAVA
ncbi:hypothetical protein [uncultured Microbulbifer sp.]|uniref:hypothetical protein n=1 Tax=uncultured Microbulbifer sp. TaxID=348147 RepID=UPI0025DD7AE3|nr:hypothetical protein [uncultured Microbulbifer sp.]